MGGLHTLEDSRYGEVDGALRAAFQEARAQTPERDLRVAFLRRGMSGGTYPLFALADADADIVIDGHVPAINFERRVRSQDVGLLRSLGVTHVLFDRPLEDSARLALREQLDVVLEAGDYTLATLRGLGGRILGQLYRESPVPEELYPTSYLTDRALDFLDRYAGGELGPEPFLLKVSYPDPHHPCTPPGR